MTDRQRHGFILLLVVGLIAASVASDRDQADAARASTSRAAWSSSTRASPTPQTPVSTRPRCQRAVDVMDNRVNQLGVSQPQIQTEGSNQIDVQLPDVTNVAQAEKQVGTTAQLFFYDWEANVLTADRQDRRQPGLLGERLTRRSRSSQATASTARGRTAPRPARWRFYQAVKLASKQPSMKLGRTTLGSATSTSCSARPAARPARRWPPRTDPGRRRACTA